MNLTNRHSGIKTLLTALAFLAFQCCAPLTVKPPTPAFDKEKITAILSTFEAQEGAAKTLFFSGTLTLKNRDHETDVQILMVAEVTPLTTTKSEATTGAFPYGRMKIEITHTWGKPLLHILIQGQRLDILDFTEHRFYSGSFRSKRLSERIPVPLDPAILWSLTRAFPALLEHRKTVSFAGNHITLLDDTGVEIQVFELFSEEPLPHRVCFCKHKATLVFSDFENDNGILYARQVHFHGPHNKTELEIEIAQMTFNTSLPEAVFEMEAPPDFTFVHLENDYPEY